MKVFTDTDSQFMARIFQPTASNLQTASNQEGSWTVAANATQTGNWTVAANSTQTGNWTVEATQTGAWTVEANATQTGNWTVAANSTQTGAWTVEANATQTGAWTVEATQQGSWTVVITSSSASNLQTTLGDRATRDTTVLNVSSSTTASFTFLSTVSTISLSEFAFVVKNTGTATANIKIQLSPTGDSVTDSDWVDDDTVTHSLTSSAVSVFTPTRFTKYSRVGYQQDAGSAVLDFYLQGQV